jgi:type IV secretion system protein VirB3
MQGKDHDGQLRHFLGRIESIVQKNVMFRGCTRPAMFMGVPYVPFFIGAGGTLLFAMYSGNLLWLLALPVVIFVMRQMARRDEMIFHLLGLRLQFRLRVRNVRDHDGLWVFSPNAYRKKPAEK